MVGDDQKWIVHASKLAAAALGCEVISKTMFHTPTGGAHDQETFNHEPFDVKCAGVDLHCGVTLLRGKATQWD